MRLTPISTLAMAETLRTSVQRTQSALSAAQAEATTGKVADYGLHLGGRSADLTSAWQASARIGAVLATNAVAGLRLDAAQDGLSHIAEHVQTLKAGLAVAPSPGASRQAVAAAARQSLAAIEDIVNASADGQHVFGGLATDTPPLRSYAGSPLQAALASAFDARFGFDMADPAAAGIDAPAMKAFLESDVASLFSGASWSSLHSGATDRGARAMIGLTQTATVSVTANEPGIRSAVMAGALVADFFDSAIGGGALEAVSRFVLERGGSGLTDMQASVGVMQEQIGKATSRLQAQASLYEQRAAALQGVDAFAAAARFNGLVGQLETSYALTGRIQNLSIMRFV